MNNDQFRRLVLDQTPARDQKDDGGGAPSNGTASATPRPEGSRSASALTLGSKRTSFIPMTPRNIKGGIGADFARQVRERNAANQPSRKFRSSAAPKGAKLATGYQDRTLERRDAEDDERAARIRALEEQVKLGQLDAVTFEALRDEITGGEVSATHLVKGLDRKLLERVRRGEDVLGASTGTAKGTATEDVEEEFDKLAEKEVGPVVREKAQKKGEMAPPPPAAAGVKRSRDAILAELKAQRKAAAEARRTTRPELDEHFKDIGASSGAGTRIERDEKGREVMITVDEHGNVKKKVRKVQPGEGAVKSAKEVPKFLDQDSLALLPSTKPKQEIEEPQPEEEDDDIFADAGTDYNPLGDMGDDDDDSDESESNSGEEGLVKDNKVTATDAQPDKEDELATPEAPSQTRDEKPDDPTPPPQPPPPSTNTAPRNYFKTTSKPSTEPEAPAQNPFEDANFLAAIKKASALSNISIALDSNGKDGDEDEDEEAQEARLRKRAAMLAASDRDMEDMDLGFGSSRFADDEDGEEGGKKVKLSQWKGGAADDDDDNDDDGGHGGGGEKKKRSRKRKGDKNSAQDVLGVLERRKQSGGGGK